MNRGSDRGAALVLAMMAVFLIAAFAASMTVLSNTELTIAANYADAAELRYVAEAALELALQEVAAVSDWGGLPAGAPTSALTDGAPGGQRALRDGTTIDLDDLHAQTVADDLTSQIFSFAPASWLQPGEPFGIDAYVVVWIGDDLEGDPSMLTLRAAAIGARRARRTVSARVQRRETGVRVVSWHELR